MYVLKMSDLLDMRGVPENHEMLLQTGLLHKWPPGMLVVFVSRQIGILIPMEIG